MSTLPENNMDDLFKRASEEYPLRTDTADWDQLVAALDKDLSMIRPPVCIQEDEDSSINTFVNRPINKQSL